MNGRTNKSPQPPRRAHNRWTNDAGDCVIFIGTGFMPLLKHSGLPLGSRWSDSYPTTRSEQSARLYAFDHVGPRGYRLEERVRQRWDDRTNSWTDDPSPYEIDPESSDEEEEEEEPSVLPLHPPPLVRSTRIFAVQQDEQEDDSGSEREEEQEEEERHDIVAAVPPIIIIPRRQQSALSIIPTIVGDRVESTQDVETDTIARLDDLLARIDRILTENS